MNINEVPTMIGETEESAVDAAELREELIHLAEAGDIKYTPKYIKKSNHSALERIKRDYLRRQTDEANEFISDNIIAKISELMDKLEMIGESGEMEKELQDNKLLKRDLKNIIGLITPYIPLVGLLCGGVIVGKHVISNRYNSDKNGEHKEQDQQEQQGD